MSAKILVLEDDDHFRSVIVEALTDEGYIVSGCGSGDEAVEKARQDEFTLIVADIKMKGLDGLGAVSLIQSLQPEMRSLVVTGFADTIEHARANNLCLDGFLKKPFDLDVLLDQIEKLLEEQSSAQAEAKVESDKLQWARWVNDREGTRLSDLESISAPELIRIARSLSSRIGLGGFESEQLISAQLWQAATESGAGSIPAPLQTYLTSQNPGLARDASLALSTLHQKVDDPIPDYLKALVEELKDSESADTTVETNLLETARLLFQRGDYQASSKALEEFFASQKAYGRDRIRGQMLRAHLYLRTERPDKAEQIVQRMMESSRQDGPMALSEACLAAGYFLLRRGSKDKAQKCYEEAGKACSNLGFERESTVCQSICDFLKAPKPTPALRERLVSLTGPEFERSLAGFRPTLDIILESWGTTFEDAVRGTTVTEPQNRLELHSLGGFKAFYNGEEIPKSWWRSSKARQLFCYLALDHGRLSEEALIEQFWPGDPEKGRNNLYTAASYIRGALKKAGIERDPLIRSGGSLEISRDLTVWHDCGELIAAKKFEDVKDGRRAVSLYKGTFLPDCYMDWAEATKRMADEAALDISLRLAKAALDEGRLSEAVECSRTALAISPCLGTAHTIVMNSLIKQERYAEVLRHYESCKQTYRIELEDSPPVEVEMLYQQARLAM